MVLCRRSRQVHTGEVVGEDVPIRSGKVVYQHYHRSDEDLIRLRVRHVISVREHADENPPHSLDKVLICVSAPIPTIIDDEGFLA